MLVISTVHCQMTTVEAVFRCLLLIIIILLGFMRGADFHVLSPIIIIVAAARFCGESSYRRQFVFLRSVVVLVRRQDVGFLHEFLPCTMIE